MLEEVGERKLSSTDKSTNGLTRDEFYELGKNYYGEDMKKWYFRCSLCGFNQSQNSIVEYIKTKGFWMSKRYGKITLENIKELKPSIESECLSPECDYVSYGLIPSTFCKYDGFQVEGKYVFKYSLAGFIEKETNTDKTSKEETK